MNSINRNLELVYTISLMDLKQRYQNSKIGFLWSFIKPLLQFCVYYIVFGVTLKVNDSPDYPLRLFLGILIWTCFSEGTSMGLMSYIGKKSLVTKVNIQKELIPIAAYLTAAFNFILNFVVFLVLYHFIEPDFWKIYSFKSMGILLISFMIYSISIISINIIIATLNALFKDIQSIWELLLMYGVFLSPIIYTLPIEEEFLPLYYFANPIAFPLENIRSIFFSTSDLLWNKLDYAIPYIIGVVFWAFLAWVVNKKLQNKVADYL